jgi:NADPH:quinone reductase-like Zn-dependent oxidoreductase
MKVVEFDRYGPQSVLEYRERPAPEVGTNELLVRNFAAAINPKDAYVREGRFRALTGTKFPMRLGWDFAGVVEKVGPAVHQFRCGDRVFGSIRSWRGGAYAEYVCAKQWEMALLPDSISYVTGAAIPIAGLTALQALQDIGGIRPGDQVCINGGSGGVGTFAIQIARELGAHVTAICSDNNLERCQNFGAEKVLDYKKERIEDSTNQFKIFFDVHGNKCLDQVQHLLDSNGVYISTIPSETIFKDQLKTLLAPKRSRLMVVKSRTADLADLATYVLQGAVKSFVEKEFDFDEIATAHKEIESMHTRGKLVLKIAKDQ